MSRLQDVILYDTRAAQPAATDVAIGTLYGVTDEGSIVERSNGTTWDPYSPEIGSAVEAWDADLDAIAALGSTGLAARTAANTWAQRTITAGTGVLVTNGAGVAGNPTITTATAFFDAGNSGTAFTLDWTDGDKQLITLTDNVTAITLDNPVSGARYTVKIATGAGSFTVTGWPAAVLWQDGTEPVITTTASKVDIVVFIYDGTNYFGVVAQNF